MRRTILAVLLACAWGIAAHAADKPAPAADKLAPADKGKAEAAAPAAKSSDAKAPDAKPAETNGAETKPSDAKAAAKPAAAPAAKTGEKAKTAEKAKPRENKCVFCHSNPEVWEDKDRHLQISRSTADEKRPATLSDAEWAKLDAAGKKAAVAAWRKLTEDQRTAAFESRMAVLADEMLAKDIHWQKGIRCVDCHGGDPTEADSRTVAHSQEAGFRSLKNPAVVPELCGKCHSDIAYMKRFQASPRTDQLAEYWTSGHGKALKAKGDKAVATCTSCHNKPHGTAADRDSHGIRPVSEPDAPVYRTHVAETCKKCHGDAKLMAGRTYHGKPLGTDQYEQWRDSVHAQAMFKKGDLSAPTCNNCHGNHGAVPPQVDSVANVCGTCHGRVVKFFADTKMKHSFEKAGLPGCVTCHGNHHIVQPSDEMLGMEGGAVCLKCHADGKYGATVAGAETAKTLRRGLDQLRLSIKEAEQTLTEAGRLGMEVSKPRFELRKATDALTNSRVQIHSFALEPSQKLITEGQAVADAVRERGEALLKEHDARRVWLAASLVPIVVVVVLLLLYIRKLPIPQAPPH